MSLELDQVLERTRQLREQRARNVGKRLEQAATNTRAQLGPLAAGARVFDTVTGQEGEVVHGTRENIIIPTA